MNKKEFFPPSFFDALLAEMSLNDISKKLKCSVTTSEKNLQRLIDDGIITKKWKYGMWMYRRLSKKEIYDKKWRMEHPERIREANRLSARRQRERDPEKVKTEHRDWARNNPEKSKASCDKWRAKNREYDLRTKRERYQKNKRGGIRSMSIIHSANAYRDYIWYHKIYYTWYENELVCGQDRNNTRLFLWLSDRFICRECKFEVNTLHGDLTPKQQTQIVDHIKSNHFVLIKINPFQKDKGVAENKENKSVPRIVKGVRFRHPLKPWKDPESLFCDTEFLTKFIGKKPTEGRECK